MSQKGVERLLGRLLTDRAFRRHFYEEPVAACIGETMEVTTRELEAVLKLAESSVVEFSKQIDPRIVRAALGSELRARGGAAGPIAARLREKRQQRTR